MKWGIKVKKTIAVPETVYLPGAGQGIILLHAYSGTPNDVRMLGRYLNNRGYAVLLPLFSGHGTSQPEDILAAGPDFWAEDLRKSFAFMKAQGFSQVAVFGLSLGGVYAMKALADEPNFVVGGGAFCSPLVPEAKTNILPTFLAYAQKLLAAEELSAEATKSRLMTIEESLVQQLAEIKVLTTTVYQQLAQIAQPTMLVQGAKDQMLDPETVYLSQAKLKSARSEVYWYQASGHVITIGPERQQLQEDVLKFIVALPWSN